MTAVICDKQPFFFPLAYFLLTMYFFSSFVHLLTFHFFGGKGQVKRQMQSPHVSEQPASFFTGKNTKRSVSDFWEVEMCVHAEGCCQHFQPLFCLFCCFTTSPFQAPTSLITSKFLERIFLTILINIFLEFSSCNDSVALFGTHCARCSRAGQTQHKQTWYLLKNYQFFFSIW